MKKVFLLLGTVFCMFSVSLCQPIIGEAAVLDEGDGDVGSLPTVDNSGSQFGILADQQNYLCPSPTFSMTIVPDTLCFLVNRMNPNDFPLVTYNALSAIYGKETDGKTMDEKQCLAYSQELGYKSILVDGQPSFDTIKTEIDNNRPVMAFLTCNQSYWIEQESAVVIWGYSKSKMPTEDGNDQIVTEYMVTSLGHYVKMNDLTGFNNIQLTDTNTADPSQNSLTYSWTSTLFGFQK